MPLAYFIQNIAPFCPAKLQNNQLLFAKCFDDMANNIAQN